MCCCLFTPLFSRCLLFRPRFHSDIRQSSFTQSLLFFHAIWIVVVRTGGGWGDSWLMFQPVCLFIGLTGSSQALSVCIMSRRKMLTEKQKAHLKSENPKKSILQISSISQVNTKILNMNSEAIEICYTRTFHIWENRQSAAFLNVICCQRCVILDFYKYADIFNLSVWSIASAKTDKLKYLVSCPNAENIVSSCREINVCSYLERWNNFQSIHVHSVGKMRKPLCCN